MKFRTMKIGTKNVNKQNQRSIPITLEMVIKAYRSIKSKGKAAGIDGVTLKRFQEKVLGNLYLIYNRLSSGSYFPPGVKRVQIPKEGGKKRNLGIPTFGDRIAQKVIKNLIEPKLDEIFYEESYGYRPGKSAIDAVKAVRSNCNKMSWVIDLDIKKYFDSISHELLMKALEKHIKEKWVLMYIRRWLEAPVLVGGNEKIEKEGMGTPQGGVISPILANLFLHYALDSWLKKNYPTTKFVRYCDDVVIHCRSQKEAEEIQVKIKTRLVECKLEVNEEKTKIAYCKNQWRRGKHQEVKFDFLGYSFKPTGAYSIKRRRKYLIFGASISKKASKKLLEKLKGLKGTIKKCSSINEVAKLINPVVGGWLNYFTKLGKWEANRVMSDVEYRLVKWLTDRYKRLKRSKVRGFNLLNKIRKKFPNLFHHWRLGFTAF